MDAIGVLVMRLGYTVISVGMDKDKGFYAIMGTDKVWFGDGCRSGGGGGLV